MTECARCGNCCEGIRIGFNPAQYDPDDPNFDLGERTRTDITFILKHWKLEKVYEDGVYEFSCNQLNTVTRLCEAHDDRPPVCRGYPWYERAREAWADSNAAETLPPQCSFNADVRTFLPIIDVN